MPTSEIDSLIERAHHLRGPRYAEMLRINIEIARRERDNPPVPQAWIEKGRRLGREYDRELARFERDLERSRREFWGRS